MDFHVTGTSTCLRAMCLGFLAGLLSAAAFAPQAAAGQVSAPPGVLETPAFAAVSEDISEQRRAVYVRVAQRADEGELLDIARQVLAQGKKSFARTYVNFILPGMQVNQTAWASVLFAPEPKVLVHGLTRQDEALFLAEYAADKRFMLGSWLVSPPAAPGRLTIYADHGKVFAEWRLRNGQKTVEELHDFIGRQGRRFALADGGYYVLSRSGDLEIWDRQTLIATAERITPERAQEVVASLQPPFDPSVESHPADRSSDHLVQVEPNSGPTAPDSASRSQVAARF